MISIAQIQVNIVRAYIRHIEESFPIPTYESAKLLIILKIYLMHQVLFLQRKRADFEQLMAFKQGVRSAEIFLQEILGNDNEDMAGLVSAIVLELTKAIVENEALYPEMKFAFDRERSRYRAMKYAADKALQLN